MKVMEFRAVALWPQLREAANQYGKRWRESPSQSRVKHMTRFLEEGYSEKEMISAIHGWMKFTANMPNQRNWLIFESIFKVNTIERNIEAGLEVEAPRITLSDKLSELPSCLRPTSPKQIAHSAVHSPSDPILMTWRGELEEVWRAARDNGQPEMMTQAKKAWSLVSEHLKESESA